MAFYEWLADGKSEVTENFVIFATLSLLAFAVLVGFTADLVVRAVKALRNEHRQRKAIRQPRAA